VSDQPAIQVPLTEIEKAELNVACAATLTPMGVLLLRRALFELDHVKAQLAATHAAIRALPRHSACDITDRFQRWVCGDDDYVLAEDLNAALARLLGDPAQEQP